jgi:hypothetical protein
MFRAGAVILHGDMTTQQRKGLVLQAFPRICDLPSFLSERQVQDIK